MTWVAIQATTPRDAYWKLTQAFFTSRNESLRSRGPFYVLNNLVLEMSHALKFLLGRSDRGGMPGGM